MGTYRSYTALSLKEGSRTEEQIEIPSYLKIMMRLERGSCLVCNKIGSEIIESVYLCIQCQQNFQEVVLMSTTIECKTGKCFKPIIISCSFCSTERIYKNVSNALKYLVPDFEFEQSSFEFEEDISSSSVVDLTSIDRAILNQLNDSLDDFLMWIFDQGDVFKLTPFEATNFLLTHSEKGRFLFFAMNMFGLHGVAKVKKGYVRLEDIRYMPLRRLTHFAITLQLSPFNRKNFYLLKWLTFFHPDNLAEEFDLLRDEEKIKSSFIFKVLLDNNWKLLAKIDDKDGHLISTAKYVLNAASKASEMLLDMKNYVVNVEDSLRFLFKLGGSSVSKFYYFLERTVEITDADLLPFGVCNVFNKILFDSYEQARYLLSYFFSEPDLTHILHYNFLKFYALKCARDAEEVLHINATDPWLPFFTALRALNRNITTLGFNDMRPINCVYLALLTDPEEEIPEMMGMTSTILTQTFCLNMCKLLNTNLMKLKSEFPKGGIKEFIKVSLPLEYLPISNFLIRIMNAVDHLKGDHPLLINASFWLNE